MKSKKATIVEQISKQMNRMLLAKLGQSGVIEHCLEKGLGNEQALRDLLVEMFPRRYGVAKGKVINANGEMSRQLDVIIYNSIACPVLFTDENRNQILPVEGVYGVIEVKTSLTSRLLSESFENLASVYALHERSNCSRNPLITGCPPFLHVFAFSDKRALRTVAAQFIELNKRYNVTQSCYSFSEKSPSFKELTGDTHLVCSVVVLDKGEVYHALDGSIRIGNFGDHTLSMFLASLLMHFDEVSLPEVGLLEYINCVMVSEWRGIDLYTVFEMISTP